MFAYVYTVTYGGPANATMVFELFIYSYLLIWSIPRIGTGAAASVILFIFVLLLVFLLIRLRKRAFIDIE